MVDGVNVSFSMEIDQSVSGSSPAATSTSAPLYAYADCEQIVINEKMVALMSLRSGSKMVVSRDVANALTYCNDYHSLDDHAAQLCALIPMLRDQRDTVLQMLGSARDMDILQNAAATVARLHMAPVESPLPPTRVFIITCDRPAAIERLLDSMLAAGDLKRHDQLILIDDSRDTVNAQRNRELVYTFNRSSAKDMLYFGPQAAQDLLTHLLAALPAQERGLRFLLDRAQWKDQPTYGLARNLALLLSVGVRAIVLDDDIVCQAVQVPQGSTGVGFSHQETREAWFYPDVTTLMRQATKCAFNPLTRQAEALGRPLASVLASLQGETSALDPTVLDNCNGQLLSVIGGASPVLLTQCGSAGDPGTAGSRWVTRLGGNSVTRLLGSCADTQEVPSSRPCWLGYTRPTIALRGVMSQMTGMDNSRLLPPYLPILRGEDALFATMTTYLHPQSVVLNFDWAVLHLPLDDRRDSDHALPYTAAVQLSFLDSYLRGKIDTSSHASVESRLVALAAEIRSIGECPADALLARVELERVSACAATLAALDAHLAGDNNSRHPGWQAYLRRYTAQAQAQLIAPGVMDGTTLPHWFYPVQDAACGFAAALDAWPNIRELSAAYTATLLAAGSLLP